jgi:hypothetical protein
MALSDAAIPTHCSASACLSAIGSVQALLKTINRALLSDPDFASEMILITRGDANADIRSRRWGWDDQLAFILPVSFIFNNILCGFRYSYVKHPEYE